MLDKTDAPSNIAEGYGITLAYGCLLETVRSLNLVINGESTCAVHEAAEYDDVARVHRDVEGPAKPVHVQLIHSSSAGLLSAFQFLLRARFVLGTNFDRKSMTFS